MHEKEEREGKCYLEMVVPLVVGLGQALLPIKIMWWFTEPTFINLFSIYIFTLPNRNRIMKDPIMNLFSLHDQSWKTITESSWSIPISNKRMWLGGMIDNMTQGSCIPIDSVKSSDDYSSLVHSIGTRACFDSDKINSAY